MRPLEPVLQGGSLNVQAPCWFIVDALFSPISCHHKHDLNLENWYVCFIGSLYILHTHCAIMVMDIASCLDWLTIRMHWPIVNVYWKKNKGDEHFKAQIW